MKTPILFIKFGSKEHIEKLFYEGVLFLNTVDYFKKLESEQGIRGDFLEGASELYNFYEKDKAILTINPKQKDEIRMNITNAQMRQFHSYQGNIFSLYSIFDNEKETQKIEFDKTLKNFGDTALIITDINDFLLRVGKKLKEKNFKFYWGDVDYYNAKEKSIKKLGIFNKSSDFQYQKEFRIYVKNPINEPLKIEIGSINEISKLLKSEDLTKLKIERKKT
jgi:hypothetical protein